MKPGTSAHSIKYCALYRVCDPRPQFILPFQPQALRTACATPPFFSSAHLFMISGRAAEKRTRKSSRIVPAAAASPRRCRAPRAARRRQQQGVGRGPRGRLPPSSALLRAPTPGAVRQSPGQWSAWGKRRWGACPNGLCAGQCALGAHRPQWEGSWGLYGSMGGVPVTGSMRPDKSQVRCGLHHSLHSLRTSHALRSHVPGDLF